jgi:tetratricopeptide (TPR) repeat protein
MIEIMDAIPYWFFGPFGFFLIANAIFSVIVVLLASFVLRRQFSQMKAIFMLLPLCLTIPIVVPVFVIFYAGFLYYLSLTNRKINFLHNMYPEFMNEKDEKLIQHGEGGALARLSSKAFSDQDKLKSLVSLNNNASVVINKINEQMLQEGGDELRLYAYGILSKQENKLYNDIHDIEIMLDNAKSNKNLFMCYKALAYKFWELIYMNLAHEDIKLFAMQKVEYFIDKAFELNKNDLSLYILYGRLRLAQKKYDEAKSYFEHALKENAPDNKVVPYLAEIAFIEKDYRKIKAYYSQSKNIKHMPLMGGSAKFWSN